MKKFVKPVTVAMMSVMLSATLLTACGGSKTETTAAVEATTEAAAETTEAAAETTETAAEITETAVETTKAADESIVEKAETVEAVSLEPKDDTEAAADDAVAEAPTKAN